MGPADGVRGQGLEQPCHGPAMGSHPELASACLVECVTHLRRAAQAVARAPRPRRLGASAGAIHENDVQGRSGLHTGFSGYMPFHARVSSSLARQTSVRRAAGTRLGSGLESRKLMSRRLTRQQAERRSTETCGVSQRSRSRIFTFHPLATRVGGKEREYATDLRAQTTVCPICQQNQMGHCLRAGRLPLGCHAAGREAVTCERTLPAGAAISQAGDTRPDSTVARSASGVSTGITCAPEKRSNQPR